MEMKFSETIKVDLDSVHATSSPLIQRMQALEIGEGFAVSGVDRTAISARCSQLGNRIGRKFGTKKQVDGSLLIYRKS